MYPKNNKWKKKSFYVMDMYQILYLKVDICHQRCQSDFLNTLVQKNILSWFMSYFSKVDDGV